MPNGLTGAVDGIDGLDLGVHDGFQYAWVYDTLQPNRNPFACYAKVYRRETPRGGWLWVCYVDDAKREPEKYRALVAMITALEQTND